MTYYMLSFVEFIKNCFKTKPPQPIYEIHYERTITIQYEIFEYEF